MININVNGQYQIYKNGKLEQKFNNYILKNAFTSSGLDLSTLKLTTSIDVNLSGNFDPIEFPIVKTINRNTDVQYLKKLNIPSYIRTEDDNYYYYNYNYFFKYDDKENLGNFTALMIGNYSATYAKDDAGNKTTFSKLEDETLDIIYTIRFKVSKNVSMTFNGVTYNNLVFKDLNDISFSYWISHDNIPSNKLFLLNSVKDIGGFYFINTNLFYYNTYMHDIELRNNKYNKPEYPLNEITSIDANIFKIKNTTAWYFGYDNKYFQNLFLNSIDTYSDLIDLENNNSVNLINYDISIKNLYLSNQSGYITKHIFNYIDSNSYNSYYNNIIKILKIDKNNVEEYNNYITYDYFYKIILKDIKKFQTLYPQVLEKINVSTDKTIPITFDDAYKFIENIDKFIDELKIFLGSQYTELFYNYKIEFPDDVAVKFTNNYTNINNVIKYVSLYLEFEFTFNVE